jgi:transcription-repair coupling factor (superfamily II helicase)
VTELKLLATPLGIRKLELGANGGRVLFTPKPNVDPLTIIRMIQTLPKVYALDGQDKLRIKLQLEGAAERLRVAREIITALAKRTAA